MSEQYPQLRKLERMEDAKEGETAIRIFSPGWYAFSFTTLSVTENLDNKEVPSQMPSPEKPKTTAQRLTEVYTKEIDRALAKPTDTSKGETGTLYEVTVAHQNNIGLDGKPVDPRPHDENPETCWCWASTDTSTSNSAKIDGIKTPDTSTDIEFRHNPPAPNPFYTPDQPQLNPDLVSIGGEKPTNFDQPQADELEVILRDLIDAISTGVVTDKWRRTNAYTRIQHLIAQARQQAAIEAIGLPEPLQSEVIALLLGLAGNTTNLKKREYINRIIDAIATIKETKDEN